MFVRGFPGGARGKEPTCQCSRHKRRGFDPWVRKMPWRRAWQTTPGFLPEKYHGQRSLVGYNFINHKESDTTEHWTHTETAVWGVFIQEKWMNLSNSKQWDLQQFKLTYSHSSIFSSGSLENLSLQSQWKPIQAGNHWRHQNGVCAPSKPHSQRTVII